MHQDHKNTVWHKLNQHADIKVKHVSFGNEEADIYYEECWPYADEFYCLKDGVFYEGDLRKMVLDLLTQEAKDDFKKSSSGEQYKTSGYWTVSLPYTVHLSDYTAAMHAHHIQVCVSIYVWPVFSLVCVLFMCDICSRIC